MLPCRKTAVCGYRSILPGEGTCQHRIGLAPGRNDNAGLGIGRLRRLEPQIEGGESGGPTKIGPPSGVQMSTRNGAIERAAAQTWQRRRRGAAEQPVVAFAALTHVDGVFLRDAICRAACPTDDLVVTSHIIDTPCQSDLSYKPFY